MENTKEIMTKNEEVIEKDETLTIAEVETPVNDLNEGTEPESDLTTNIALGVGGLVLITGAVIAVVKGAKKIGKTKPVKKFRRAVGNWILKGLDEEDAPATVLPIEVVDETAEDTDQE